MDLVAKQVHFTPTHTMVTANGTARLFLHHVWKLHRLPQSIMLDRGPQFVAEFMQELYCLLDITIASSTAYHPQMDGQTEQVNQELEQYLRLFVNEQQDNWAELLPLVEFQYNNHVHTATQTTLFLLDTGQTLRMGFEPHAPSRVEAVNKFVECMKSATEEARSAIRKSKDDMAQHYN